MRIASWNVFNRNADVARVLDAVRAFDADVGVDVIAFQELLDPMAEALNALDGWQFFQADDFDEKNERTRLGLLTRLPARNHHIVDHNPARNVSPSLLGRLQGWRECIQSHGLEVSGAPGTPGASSPVTIINLHLSCGVSMAARAAQLQKALAPHAECERLVVVGDFNSFGKPALNLAVGWATGIRWREMLTDERAALYAQAKAQALMPTSQSAITYPSRRLHLDHILVRGMAVDDAKVWPDLMGSDHLAISANLTEA